MTEVRRHTRTTQTGKVVNVRRHHRDGPDAVTYDREGEPETWSPPAGDEHEVDWGEGDSVAWDVPVADEQGTSSEFRAMFLQGAAADEPWWDDDAPGAPPPNLDSPPPASLRVAPAADASVDWAPEGTTAAVAIEDARRASMDGQLRTVVARMPDGTLAPLAQFRNGQPVAPPGSA